MGFDVFDYRTDVRNVVITPEIRSRFMRMEPGDVAVRHSHDLGHEVFLVLEGQCEFEIDGDRAVLGPGQMCFARRDQMHQVRNPGDVPMTMYLSVTPHIDPTHTMWDDEGRKRPYNYGAATYNEQAEQTGGDLTAIAKRHVAAARSLEAAARANVAAQTTGVEALVEANARNDRAAVRAAVDAMWTSFFETYRALLDLSESWNTLAPEAGAAPSE
ncbi:MAG: cupin domain-containing protein [Thermomicrobiales bacterium]|nr:cupin domain-containing protein [Thermomicrobiales bacterium]